MDLNWLHRWAFLLAPHCWHHIKKNLHWLVIGGESKKDELFIVVQMRPLNSFNLFVRISNLELSSWKRVWRGRVGSSNLQPKTFTKGPLVIRKPFSSFYFVRKHVYREASTFAWWLQWIRFARWFETTTFHLTTCEQTRSSFSHRVHSFDKLLWQKFYPNLLYTCLQCSLYKQANCLSYAVQSIIHWIATGYPPNLTSWSLCVNNCKATLVWPD